MIVLAITIKDLTHELHLGVKVHTIAQHLCNAAPMMPDLEVLFLLKTDLLQPGHLVFERKTKFLDELPSVEPRVVVTLTMVDYLLGQNEGALTDLFLL